MQTTCLLLLHSLHNTWRRASGSQSWSCSLRSTSLALCLTHALFGLPARQPSHLTTQALTAHTLALALHRNSPASAQHAGRARVRTAARDRLLQLLPRLLHRGVCLRRLHAGRLGSGLQALQQLGSRPSRARGGRRAALQLPVASGTVSVSGVSSHHAARALAALAVYLLRW